MLTGLLLQESLKDLTVLDRLHITKTETWDAANAAEYQPRVWTAISFEVDDVQADEVINELSHSLKTPGWYIDARQADRVIVIFPNQVFKYSRGDQASKADAQGYACSIGIPTSQIDWGD
jgi:hypothetical protein